MQRFGAPIPEQVNERADSPNPRRRASLRKLQAEAGRRFDARVVSALCEISQGPPRDQAPYAAAIAAELHLAFPEQSPEHRREESAQ
jgi:hypothetical protein